MELQELLYIARQADACHAALDKIQQYQTLEEAEQDPDAPKWAVWLLENVDHLPQAFRRRLAAKAVEACTAHVISLLEEDLRPLLSERLVKEVMDRCLSEPGPALEILRWADLSADEVQRAWLKVCESPWHSLFMLRSSASIPGGLPEEASRMAQLSCCDDIVVSKRLLSLHKVEGLPLHPEVETRLREMWLM